MRILHIVQAYYPAIGGSEWLTKNLSESLVKNYGDEVTVFTTNAYKTEVFWRGQGPFMPAGVERINGVNVRRFPVFSGLQRIRELLARGSYRLRLPLHDWFRTIQTGPIILNLRQEIAASKAKVVFATSFPFMHMYDAVAGAQRGKMPVVLLGAIHPADRWGYDRPMIYQAIKKATQYIAHTAFEKDYLARHGIDKAKITIIGGGVHLEKFTCATGATIRARYGLYEQPVVGVFARHSPLKRLDIVLQAMPYVWEKRPDTYLLMAGARTAHSMQLESLIAAFPPEQRGHVILVYDFADDQKGDLFAACDLIAHPSTNESFGIVFVEAWACSKPVIGARYGAVSSVVEQGIDGLLYEYPDPESLAQAILTLINNPSKRYEMGQAGRRKVQENFTWDIVTAKLRQVYEQVTTENS
mgnify:CR=1 FL=1